MPFTLSHPAAVLPLLRTPFSRAALVAGAVAPDLPYFLVATGLPVSAQSWYEPFANATTTHTLPGALTVGLPYTLALWALLLAGHRPLASLLSLPFKPPSDQADQAERTDRIERADQADRTDQAERADRTDRSDRTASAVIRRTGWILLSALIGLATHVVWDSFTHYDGFVVSRVTWLNTTLAGSLSWARALQHVSTVGGLAAIAVYGWRRRARPRIGAGATPRRVLLALALCTAAGAVAHAWWWLAGPEAAATGLPLDAALEGVLSDAAKGAGAGLIAALALYVAVWWTHRAVTAGRGAGAGYEDGSRADSAA